MIPLLKPTILGHQGNQCYSKLILWGSLLEPVTDILEATIGLENGQHGRKTEAQNHGWSPRLLYCYAYYEPEQFQVMLSISLSLFLSLSLSLYRSVVLSFSSYTFP